MSATWLRIAGWGIRFLVAVGLYVMVVVHWVDNAAVGWERLGVVFAGSMLGIAAAAAWCVAIIAGHLFMSNVHLRLVAHPFVVAGLFVLFGLGVVGWYMGNSIGDAWSVVKDFLLLVAVCALVDACIGFLLARWMAPVSPMEPRDRR